MMAIRCSENGAGPLLRRLSSGSVPPVKTSTTSRRKSHEPHDNHKSPEKLKKTRIPAATSAPTDNNPRRKVGYTVPSHIVKPSHTRKDSGSSDGGSENGKKPYNPYSSLGVKDISQLENGEPTHR